MRMVQKRTCKNVEILPELRKEGEVGMSNRETVITHLQIIHTWASFARERDLQFFTAKHLEDIAQWTADALALLKEQTPVKPVKSKLSWEHGYNWDIWDCGYCGSQLRSDANYCDRCGHKVNWDDVEENDA